MRLSKAQTSAKATASHYANITIFCSCRYEMQWTVSHCNASVVVRYLSYPSMSEVFAESGPKWEIFENPFRKYLKGHGFKYGGQIWWKSAIEKLPKSVFVLVTKWNHVTYGLNAVLPVTLDTPGCPCGPVSHSSIHQHDKNGLPT